MFLGMQLFPQPRKCQQFCKLRVEMLFICGLLEWSSFGTGKLGKTGCNLVSCGGHSDQTIRGVGLNPASQGVSWRRHLDVPCRPRTQKIDGFPWKEWGSYPWRTCWFPLQAPCKPKKAGGAKNDTPTLLPWCFEHRSI